MMERRRALTIPFTADKDNLMENPLKIPMTCLPSECGKLEQQVSWTAIAGCKYKSRNSQHKNGPVMFDHSNAALKSNQVIGRKLRLVLTDVLKTEMGKNYMEKVKMRSSTRSRGRLKDPPKEIGESREESQICRSTRFSNREAHDNKSKCLTPKSSLKTSPSSSQRTRVKKRLNSQKEDKEETELIGKEGAKEEKIVKDCEVSLSLKPTGEATSCDEMSSDSIKDKSAVTEKREQQSLKRKKKYGSQCNGRSSSKRHCKSVLCLSGEDGGHVSSSGENGVDGGKAFFPEDGTDGEQDPASASQGESENDVDLENMDRCIVQFTVGGDDGMEALVPVITPNLEAEGIVGNNRWSLSCRHDCTTQTSPFEPIVLSSDEEEGNSKSHGSRQVVHADTVIQEAVSKQEEVPDSQDIQMLQVLVEESPPSAPASPIPEVDFSCLSVPFCAFHCGDYKARANGGLMIAKNKIIIPLQDTSEQQKENLSFDRKDLRRYSIWDQQELDTWGVQLEGFREPFSVVLLFYVSETAAAAIQQDLSWLCIKEDGSINTGKASPFVLLTLKDPLEGMEGALLRSVLDLDCINSMTHEQIISAQDKDEHSSLVNLDAPVLSFDDAIELIRRTGLDSNLLSMLGIKSSDFEPMMDQGSSSYDEDEIPTAHIWLNTDFQKESDLEVETAPEDDAETKIEPKEDQKEEEAEKSPDSKKEKSQPVYAVCHGRTKGSYSVSLSKPDSSWIKYKHQGLARRLIQFPPPPLKGGITVTMEDLQCLDSGQYLNDVIIDFYLKYLIQNTPAAITERCHIFSSFFYKQLTRRDNASEGGKSDSCQRQRRHQRVKTWTRHVDIFKKDFLFVPVNQESHWYLVVVCFAGLEEPEFEDWTGETEGQDESQHSKSSNDDAETPATLKSSDNMDSETGTESTKDPPPRPVNCTELTCQRRTVCKRPCILIMDSLKLSLHERVFKLLREYLQSEWESRRGSMKDFGSDQIKNSYCKVPLQDNSSDCGLYLLQYVECFLKDPVVHFDLPLLLQQWFPRQLVRKKRDRIRDLILNLYRRQNLENKQK